MTATLSRADLYATGLSRETEVAVTGSVCTNAIAMTIKELTPMPATHATSLFTGFSGPFRPTYAGGILFVAYAMPKIGHAVVRTGAVSASIAAPSSRAFAYAFGGPLGTRSVTTAVSTARTRLWWEHLACNS